MCLQFLDNYMKVLYRLNFITFHSITILADDVFLYSLIHVQICQVLIELCHITLSVPFLLRVISNQCHDVSFLTCQTKLLRKRLQEYRITMWVYLSSIFVHSIYKVKSYRYVAVRNVHDKEQIPFFYLYIPSFNSFKFIL